MRPAIWAVTMVRDEMDALPYTLAHLDTQGLTGIIVADNLSCDGTWEYLHDVELQTRLIVTRDTEEAYYQSRKMTALAYQGFAEGAAWVVPFDADEIWRSRADSATIADVLARQPLAGVDYIQVPLHNYFPCSNDNTAEPNPFRRITHRDPDPAPLPKVIVGYRPNLVIEQGNHGVHAADGQLLTPLRTTTLEIAHFPWRGYSQFERKILNGAAAYRATDLPDSVGSHWRNYGDLYERGGADALRAWYEQWFQDPPMDLEYHPVA